GAQKLKRATISRLNVIHCSHASRRGPDSCLSTARRSHEDIQLTAPPRSIQPTLHFAISSRLWAEGVLRETDLPRSSSYTPAGKLIEVLFGKGDCLCNVDVDLRNGLARGFVNLSLLVFGQLNGQFAPRHGTASRFQVGRFNWVVSDNLACNRCVCQAPI